MMTEKQSNTLEALRGRIDEIDQTLQKLINERAACALEVATLKKASAPKESEVTFYRPERESQVLRKIKDTNKGPLSSEEMARLFREIMSSCLALEQRMRIAFLGPEGTFTQAAALKHFGRSVEGVSLSTINEVFREVEAGAASYGVVPVENSTEGMVNHTLDTFMRSRLKICGEVELRIHHHLLISEACRADSITRVYSHQQSLAQCRQWLDSHWPSIERIAVSSNAEAARRIKDEWHAAAIGGDMAAEQYKLKKLATNIEDNPDNTTRFLIIGQQEVPPSGEDKTSIIVSSANRPGALYEILAPFYQEGVSLTRIETRPSTAGKWTYVFFIDFEGHRNDPAIEKALQRVYELAVEVQFLGSYPKAVLGVI